MTPTKVRVLEAAVELLGTEGLRSLTHARVDERAGSAEGLDVQLLPHPGPAGDRRQRLDRRADLASADDIATIPHTPADLVEGLAIGIEMLTGPHRTVTAARLTLFMEANHNPEIRTAVSRTRSVMERSIVAVMARLGANDPRPAALALMACSEGIILHRIARHDTTDPRPLLRVVVDAALPD